MILYYSWKDREAVFARPETKFLLWLGLVFISILNTSVLLKNYGYIALCSESINDYKNDMIISILCDMRMIIGGYLTRDIVSIGWICD